MTHPYRSVSPTEPIPHPLYRRRIKQLLSSFDDLSYLERDIVLTFIRLLAAHEDRQQREWRSSFERDEARRSGGGDS